MNARKKAELKGLIAGLEAIYEDELKAVKRHEKAGNDDYAAHAAWCADGIQEAIMLFENKFPNEALELLRMIVASFPSDVLQPHKKTEKKPADLPASCANGDCNHPEHM